MEFRHLLVNFIMIGIFAFALIGWSIFVQMDNSGNSSLMENQLINSTFVDLGTELSSTQSQAEGQRESQEQENPTASSGDLILFTITKAGKVFTGTIRAIYDITIGGASKVIGIPPIIMAGFTSILLVSIILLAWSLYKQGR